MGRDDQRSPGTTGCWLLVRGFAVGGAATALAVGGHTIADGSAPPAPVSLVTAAAVGAVGIALSRLRWTFLRALALLVLTQVGLHTLFVLTQPSPPMAPMGHVHHAAASSGMPGLDPAMTGAHLGAAVLTAVLLSRGEAWLCGVLAALGLRALRLLRAVVGGYGGHPQPTPVLVGHAPRPRTGNDAWWQRGPPR